VRPNIKHKLAVLRELEAHVQETSPGFISYRNGETDTSIAERCGVSMETVKYIRQRGFGKLRERSQNKADANEKRLNNIENRVAFIEHHLGLFLAKHNNYPATPYVNPE